MRVDVNNAREWMLIEKESVKGRLIKYFAWSMEVIRGLYEGIIYIYK